MKVGNASMGQHTFRVPSDLAEVPAAADRIKAAWAMMGIGEDEAIALEICVVEAVTNAIEHAYGGKPGNWVDVTTWLTGATLTTQVRDLGTAMDTKRLASAKPLDFDPDDIEALPERGMGLSIMTQVMDEVTYEAHSGSNTLTLKKAVSLADGVSEGGQNKAGHSAR